MSRLSALPLSVARQVLVLLIPWSFLLTVLLTRCAYRALVPGPSYRCLVYATYMLRRLLGRLGLDYLCCAQVWTWPDVNSSVTVVCPLLVDPLLTLLLSYLVSRRMAVNGLCVTTCSFARGTWNECLRTLG